MEYEDAENEGDAALAGQDPPHGRYLHLFHLAKQIAQKGSRAPGRYEEIMHSLTGIVESLTVPIDGEIRDAEGRRRGRPRRTGDSRPPPAPSSCTLCGCSHDITQCRMYEAFLEEKNRYVGVMRGKVHCKLCGYAGHRKNTCPVLAAFRRTMAEQYPARQKRRKAS
jgi:hypothetical protein